MSGRVLIECIVKKMELSRKQKSKKGLKYTEHHYLSKGKHYATTPASLTVSRAAIRFKLCHPPIYSARLLL